MTFARGLVPELPALVWLYELAVVVNNVGSGMIAPFTVIYLHNGRGFSLGIAGAIVATFAALTFAASFAGGALADRVGPRRVLLGSLALQAVGLAGFAFAQHPWQGFLFMAIAGAGNGGFVPSQSSLLTAVVPPESRQAAFSVQRMADNLGMGIGAGTAGLIATSSHPRTFSLLFLVDAATVLVFAGLIACLVRGSLPRPARHADAGYRAVVRERRLLAVVALNLLYVLAGYAVFELVLPVVAKNANGLSERAIGLFYLLNTFTVAFAQLPLLRLFAGRRRMRILAAMCILWALDWLVLAVVAATRPALPLAFAAFALGSIAFALGEAGFSVQNALVADLAPDHIRGRCMALVPGTYTFGFMLGTVSAGFLLERSYTVVWIVAAAVLAAAAGGATTLDTRLSDERRRVPWPAPRLSED
jgi:MFS family permease